jgi:hypothetical protein
MVSQLLIKPRKTLGDFEIFRFFSVSGEESTLVQGLGNL